MVRWEPDARGRLEQAAYDLYLDQGFDNTTVAEIAQRAELTERTFFRHFADKREVLFSGSGRLLDFLVESVVAADEDVAPIEAVVRALEGAGEQMQQRRDHSQQRWTVIAANPVLQERELIKMASLAAALAEALRGRGVTEPAASLAAETGIALFKVAYERWVTGDGEEGLPATIRHSLEILGTVNHGAAGRPAAVDQAL